MRPLLLLLPLVLVSGVAALPAKGEPIGPYEVQTIPGGIEIRVPQYPGLRRSLSMAAAVCLVAAAGLFATRRAALPATGLAVVGLALAAAAALAAPGAERARLGREGIVVRGARHLHQRKAPASGQPAQQAVGAPRVDPLQLHQPPLRPLDLLAVAWRERTGASSLRRARSSAKCARHLERIAQSVLEPGVDVAPDAGPDGDADGLGVGLLHEDRHRPLVTAPDRTDALHEDWAPVALASPQPFGSARRASRPLPTEGDGPLA